MRVHNIKNLDEFESMQITYLFYDETNTFKINLIEYYGEDSINRFIDRFNKNRRG